MAKTHWKNLANYDYLGAYSLGEKDEITLTISNVKVERVTGNGGVSDDCLVLYFKEDKVDDVVVKPMICNKTNAKMIEKIYETPFIEEWLNKKVTIIVSTTPVKRDIVPCLRIKNVKHEFKVFKCHVCGKEITEKLHNNSIEKYGVPLCSGECLAKYNERNENNE